MILIRKRGFNLIEIAIVLAVIGLVIGGIYIAAGAVTDSNHRQELNKQLLQIVQNVRRVYRTQASFAVPSHADIAGLGLLPADMRDDGTNFYNSFSGGAWIGAGYTFQQFTVGFAGLPASACTDLATSNFGSAQIVNQMGLVDEANGTGWLGATAMADGVSPAEARSLCSLSGNTNVIQLMFQLHG